MRLRKGRLGGNRGRRAIAAGLFVVLAGFVGACSSTPTEVVNSDSADEASDADFSAVLGDLTEGLGLTDDQISAIREVMEKYRGQGREPGALWYAAADLQAILTSDQIDAIEARLADLRGEMRGQRGQRSGDGPGDFLDLSDEQLAQLKAIRESHAPEMEELRGLKRVYFAQGHSSAGILEGLRHFKFRG